MEDVDKVRRVIERQERMSHFKDIAVDAFMNEDMTLFAQATTALEQLLRDDDIDAGNFTECIQCGGLIFFRSAVRAAQAAKTNVPYAKGRKFVCSRACANARSYTKRSYTKKNRTED